MSKCVDEFTLKLEELYKSHAEKKAILNIPISLESNRGGKSGIDEDTYS